MSFAARSKEKFARIRAGAVALATVACLSISGVAFAQQQGSISGKVLDPDGLALPGASVAVSSEATGYSRTYTTTANGDYTVQNLNPGEYQVVASLSGFQSVTRRVLLTAGLEAKVELKLRLAGMAEEVTVEGLAPLVETSSNKIGGSLSGREIEDVPSNFRNFTALTQLIPGMTPAPATSSFEGGQVTANGSPAQSNVYLLDGMYNNDDRLGGSQGTQVRVVLDNIAEYQVLSNSYSAEYGGGAGAVVNMITRGGNNDFSGRAYSYYRSDKFNSRDHFLPASEPKPKEKTLQYGIGLAGPVIKNKMHFAFLAERDEEDNAKNKIFKGAGGALTPDFIGAFEVRATNLFARLDYQINPSNFLSMRAVREAAPTKGEGFPESNETADQQGWEQDLDEIAALTLTSTISDRASNVLRLGTIHEQLNTGRQTFFDFPDVVGIGYDGRDPLTIGSQNAHPSYLTGQGGTGTFTTIHTFLVSDTFSYFIPDWNGEHTVKFGGTFSLNRDDPRQGFDSGTFRFPTDAPYDPNNPATYPDQFDITVAPSAPGFGGLQAFAYDRRISGFVEDKWRTNEQLTLNLGVRYDRQRLTPASTNAFAPRVGFAYDVKGEGKTVVRGGIGKFFLFMPISGRINQFNSQVVTVSPSISINASTDECGCVLRPSLINNSAGVPGVAALSPAAIAYLNARKAAALAGTAFNRNPRLDDPNRKLAYQWAYSFGFSHELGRNASVSLDFVGNVSRDQTGELDINAPSGGRLPGGARPGVAGFDPNSVYIQGAARSTNFNRVRVLTSNSGFDADYKSMQFAFVKRMANRWSGRVSYTLQKANYVGLGNPDSRTVSNNLDLKSDYGRFASNRTHVISATATVNVAKNLNLSTILSKLSSVPINETVGQDFNADGNNNDRPIQGVSDGGKPILSPLDSNGMAVINGIDGPGLFEMAVSVRYSLPLGNDKRALDLFYDVFNLFNTKNLQPGSGNRRSSSFNVPTSANFPRQMQMGARIRF